MSELLLTGASGFLGRTMMSNLYLHFRIRTLGQGELNDFQADLSNDVPEFDNRFDIVVHCAGKAHFIPKSISEMREFFDVNLQGTKNLCYALENVGLPSSFIFISTVAVYGIEKGVCISEEAPMLARDPYGLSKIFAEKFVEAWCEKHNIICTIFRLPLLVGPNAPGNLGTMLRGIKEGYYFNIAGGKAKKSMVLACDVAQCILEVYRIGGIYNLTDGYHPSFQELSKHISIQLGKGKPLNMPLWLAWIFAIFGDLLGSKAPLNTNKLKKITSDLTYDDSKAKKSFGWKPTPVLEGFKII